MKEKIAVIAGISGEALTKVLQDKNYSVVVIGGKPLESGMAIADCIFVADLDEHNMIKSFLLKEKIKKVIIGTGHIKALLLAKFLKENNFTLSINPCASLLAKDKNNFKEFLRENSFQTPRFLLIKGFIDDIEKNAKEFGIPFVLKSPIDDFLPIKINTIEELSQFINEIDLTKTELLFEEYIEGIEVTVPFSANYEKVKALKISYYNKAKECALKGFENFSLGKLGEKREKEILNLCEEVVSKVKILGLGRVDIIVKNDIPYILECNSVMVTGIHKNQIEYGRNFLLKEEMDFPNLLIDNAIKILEK